jgi:hypothetical protein
MNPKRMTAGATFLQSLQRAVRQPEPAAEIAPSRDFQLAFALTQLLIDSGRADAAGCIVVATWQTRTQVAFEVICAERMRTPLCGLLVRVLSRPFHTAGTWLLSQHEAIALIDLSAHANT